MKEFKPGTIESILEDRLADLLDHYTISRDMFVPLVISDLKQDDLLKIGKREKMGRRKR
jgi:hypothetical protein